MHGAVLPYLLSVAVLLEHTLLQFLRGVEAHLLLTVIHRCNLEYWQKKGLKLIRLPFKWERLQLDLKGPLNQHDLNKMKELVRAAEKRDMVVILDLHNYCRRFMNNEHTQHKNNLVDPNKIK